MSAFQIHLLIFHISCHYLIYALLDTNAYTLNLKWEGRRRSAVFIDFTINLTAQTHKVLTQ